METITFKFIGQTPLLMHNIRLSNPMDPYVEALKTITGKRKKTIEDHKEIARIEWEGGLYLHKGVVAVPMRWVNKCMERGATKQKNGAQWRTGAMVMDDHHPLDYSGKKITINGSKAIPNPELDAGFQNHCFQTMAGVQRSKTLRSRPMFNDWSLTAEIAFDPTVIERPLIIRAADDAGRLCGLGDWRIEKGGPFGRFVVEII